MVFFDLASRIAVLPARCIGGPCGGVLPVQQHDVEVFGVGLLAQLVELRLRIDAVVRGHLGHEPVAIPRNALERHAQHLLHVAIGFGGFKETDAAVVGVAHQARKLVLAKVALDAPL